MPAFEREREFSQLFRTASADVSGLARARLVSKTKQAVFRVHSAQAAFYAVLREKLRNRLVATRGQLKVGARGPGVYD